MALTYAHALVLVVMAASTLAVCMANPYWKPCPNRKIVVGGSENWHFGFNYAEWALKNGPFYFNDTLGEFTT